MFKMLYATGSSSALNHCLSLLSPYSKLLTDIILNITKRDGSIEDTLEVIGLYLHEQSNLRTLSFKGDKLSSNSLFQSLLSPHCKLCKLSMRDCTVFTTDHTYQFSLLELRQADAKVYLNATDSCSAINHCLSLLSPYSKLLTDIILNITKVDFSTDESLEGIGMYHDEGSNLHTLSFKGGKLSSEAVLSLFQSLLSQHCKLHQLSLRDCTISTTDHIYQFSSFELQQDNAKVTLHATGSSSAINHCLSLLSSYSKLLTDIILNITKQDFSTDESLEGIGLYHGEQSNLHTLLFIGGKLSSEATSSLFLSLLSPHSKLHTLSMHDCTVFTTDHTFQLSFFKLQQVCKVSLNATGSSSAINHCLSLLSPYSKLLTDIILNITEQDFSTDESLKGISLYHDEQSNLHTLSFKGGKLSSEATSSLFLSLLSPHSKLCTHFQCMTALFLLLTTLSSCLCFKLQQVDAKVSLNATGSSSAINHCLSLLSPYSKLLTDIILNITEQ